MRTTSRRRAGAVLVAALLACVLAPSAGSAYDRSTAYITSADGTSLHAEVFRPEVGGRVPVVLLVSPYLDDGAGQLAYGPMFEELLDRRYAIVQVSLRGYGASGGCGDFGGAGEQADVKAAVEWAASQPWSTGRVGMWGVSYEAWTQVMALATKPRGLAAVLIQSPLVSLYRGLYMNGVHYGGGWHATPAAYAQIDLTPPTNAGPEGVVNAVTGTATSPTCYAENNAETANPDSGTAYWKERDLVGRARTSTVPVLWSHGFLDANTKPDNFSSLYPLLRGPKRAWVGQFTHNLPFDRYDPDVRERYLEEAYLWLDAHVKRDPAAVRRLKKEPGAVLQQNDGRWRNDDAWPPRDASRAAFGLRPGSFVDIVANDGSRGHGDGAVHWTFSQRLPYAVHLSGVPRITLNASGAGGAPATVVVKVYDVEPEGAARLVTRGAHANVAGKVSFDLYPQDWRFEPGHRIAVAVLGSDGTWFTTPPSGQVTVGAASLSAPVLRYDREARPYLFTDVNEPPVAFSVDDAVARANEQAFKLPPRMRRR